MLIGSLWFARWYRKTHRRHQVDLVDAESAQLKEPLCLRPGPPATVPTRPLAMYAEKGHNGDFSSRGMVATQKAEFHFPLLSATGELLPPPLTSPPLWGEVGENGVVLSRPLPSPPTGPSPVLGTPPPLHWEFPPAEYPASDTKLYPNDPSTHVRMDTVDYHTNRLSLYSSSGRSVASHLYQPVHLDERM